MKSLKYYIIGAMLPVILGACGDKNEYEPATPVDKDCMGVYFSDENPSSVVLDASEFDDGIYLDLKVRRLNTSSAADVPVEVMWKQSEFEVPVSAHFDAGQDETSIRILINDAKFGEEISLGLKLDDKYISPYTELIQGSSKWNLSAVVSEWVTLVKDVRFTKSGYVDCKSDIKWFKGQNKYKIENFCESGIDLVYSMTNYNESDPLLSNGQITPLANCYIYNATYWYLYDDATGTYPNWTTSLGQTMNQIYFYTTYCLLDMSGSYSGKSYAGYMYQYPNAGYIYIYWGDVQQY